MKSLIITKENCKLVKSNYGVTIDGENVEKLLINKLPQNLVDYDCYIANVQMIINLPESTTEIETNGYSLEEEVPDGYEKEVPAEVTETSEVDS